MNVVERGTQLRICVLTTTRADFGIMRPLMQSLYNDVDIDLRIAVTGAHLSKSYGMTVWEIKDSKLPIDAEIPILEENNTPSAMSRIMARALTGFGVYFDARRPDLIMVLGDRFEVFAVCAAATNACIPIAHLHGGETTEGSMDECFRHSITKMSYLHFAATEVYRKRIIQLGESPDRVFNVGALGVENALHTDYLSLGQLEAELGFSLSQSPYAVVTFHPVTLEAGLEKQQLSELLAVMEQQTDLNFLITKSNADLGGDYINEQLNSFAREHTHCHVVSSLGMLRYMSALKHAFCIMGNSSSGLIEAPSFGIPIINIGNRQRGRIQAKSVINCKPEREDILSALKLACTESFRQKAANAVNPYGDGRTSERICKLIKDIFSCGTIDLKKTFYDVSFEVPK